MTGAPVEPLVVGAVVLVALAGVVLVALAGVGVVAAFGAGVRAAHRATQHARAVTRIGANLTRAVVTGAVIVGVQWAVLAHTTDPTAWAVAPGVPALFAGAEIARMFAVTEIVHGRKGGRR